MKTIPDTITYLKKLFNKQLDKYYSIFETIGSNIGLLFQISDDLIDHKGNSKIAGKKTGKDQKKGKATLIGLLGYNNAVKYCNSLIININKKLQKYGSNSKKIKHTLEYILKRDR